MFDLIVMLDSYFGSGKAIPRLSLLKNKILFKIKKYLTDKRLSIPIHYTEAIVIIWLYKSNFALKKCHLIKLL